jgi:hypothetical protein
MAALLASLLRPASISKRVNFPVHRFQATWIFKAALPEFDVPPQPGNSAAHSAGSPTVELSPMITAVNFFRSGVSTSRAATTFSSTRGITWRRNATS